MTKIVGIGQGQVSPWGTKIDQFYQLDQNLL